MIATCHITKHITLHYQSIKLCGYIMHSGNDFLRFSSALITVFFYWPVGDKSQQEKPDVYLDCFFPDLQRGKMIGAVVLCLRQVGNLWKCGKSEQSLTSCKNIFNYFSSVETDQPNQAKKIIWPGTTGDHRVIQFRLEIWILSNSYTAVDKNSRSLKKYQLVC